MLHSSHAYFHSSELHEILTLSLTHCTLKLIACLTIASWCWKAKVLTPFSSCCRSCGWIKKKRRCHLTLRCVQVQMIAHCFCCNVAFVQIGYLKTLHVLLKSSQLFHCTLRSDSQLTGMSWVFGSFSCLVVCVIYTYYLYGPLFSVKSLGSIDRFHRQKDYPTCGQMVVCTKTLSLDLCVLWPLVSTETSQVCECVGVCVQMHLSVCT